MDISFEVHCEAHETEFLLYTGKIDDYEFRYKYDGEWATESFTVSLLRGVAVEDLGKHSDLRKIGYQINKQANFKVPSLDENALFLHIFKFAYEFLEWNRKSF